MVDAGALDERLRAALQSERFVTSGASRPGRLRQLTSHATQAALAETIRILSPARVLEIGTYFADTSRQLAEVMAEEDAGHLTTIDPYGGLRVPEIIAGWPRPLRKRVTFLSQNSMSFFLDLEEARTGTGLNSPFDLVFVDGHHTFEYAFFDMMRSALYLRPGGVLLVDNVEQAGPREAVRLFCANHTHWRLFTIDGNPPPTHIPEFDPHAHGAIILAPDGIEVGAISCKFDLFDLRRPRIERLRFKLRSAGSIGRLIATANLYTLPGDLHVTGVGMAATVATVEREIAPSEAADIAVVYDPPLEVSPQSSKDAVHVQIEIGYISHQPDAPNLLLDAVTPVRVD